MKTMSSNFHIDVTKEEFSKMIPTTDHIIVRLESKFKNPKLLLPRNELKDPIIPDKGTVWKLPDDCEKSLPFSLYQTVVFEKYVGVKINIVGSDNKYLLIHKKHIKMQINAPVFVETDKTCSDDAYAEIAMCEENETMPSVHTGVLR